MEAVCFIKSSCLSSCQLNLIRVNRSVYNYKYFLCEGNMRKLLFIVTTVIFSFTLNSVFAAEIEVKMLNKDADGNKMVFEPMLIVAEKGDTVTFLPTEKGHMAASIKGMLPDGIKKFKGKINKPVSIVVSEDGLYGVKCTPHLANGMVALIAVGDVKVDGFLDGVKLLKKSKARMEEMLAQLGS